MLDADAIEEALASLEPRVRERRKEIPAVEWGGWVLSDCKLLAPRAVTLQPHSAALLYMLMVAEGEVVWTNDLIVGLDTTRAALRTAVRVLRRALGNPAAIATVKDRGYRLVPSAESDPVEDLIRGLEQSLSAAKRLRERQKAES